MSFNLVRQVTNWSFILYKSLNCRFQFAQYLMRRTQNQTLRVHFTENNFRFSVSMSFQYLMVKMAHLISHVIRKVVIENIESWAALAIRSAFIATLSCSRNSFWLHRNYDIMMLQYLCFLKICRNPCMVSCQYRDIHSQ